MLKRAFLWSLCVAALAGCGDLGAGVDAYEDGRFEDAYVAFAEAERAAGEKAPAVLLYDKALAALRTGRLSEAEAAARRAAVKDEDGFGALADFLVGNAAFARCELAQAQATGPEAEPFAFDVAIGYADSARAAWQLAATSRSDWPAARRNVERALIKERELRRQKTEAGSKKPKTRPDPKPRPRPANGGSDPSKDEDPTGKGADEEPDPGATATEVELTREQVLGLLEVLAAKEKEKRDVRVKVRRNQPADVEKDW